jgi:hypothetical protein
MTEPQLADLIGRLTVLEELERARGLLHAYAAALDKPDAAVVSSFFVPDAVLVTPRGRFAGRDQIADYYRTAWAADPSSKRHFVASPQLSRRQPGLVESEAYFLFVGRGDKDSIIGWGTYQDTISVAGERPLFVSRTIDIHLRTDLDTGWPAD